MSRGYNVVIRFLAMTALSFRLAVGCSPPAGAERRGEDCRACQRQTVKQSSRTGRKSVTVLPMAGASGRSRDAARARPGGTTAVVEPEPLNGKDSPKRSPRSQPPRTPCDGSLSGNARQLQQPLPMLDHLGSTLDDVFGRGRAGSKGQIRLERIII